PADRHPGPARGGKGLSARVSHAAETPERKTVDIAGALKDAALAAVVSFGMFLPLIGTRTDSGPSGGLDVSARPKALAVIVAAVFVASLLRSLVFSHVRIEPSAETRAKFRAGIRFLGRLLAPVLLISAVMVPFR